MTKLLSQEQVNQYQDSGFVSPVDVLDQEEINRCLTEIEIFENETGKPIDFPHKSRCHQLFSWADYLIHHPKILDAVEEYWPRYFMLSRNTLGEASKIQLICEVASRRHIFFPRPGKTHHGMGGPYCCR